MKTIAALFVGLFSISSALCLEALEKKPEPDLLIKAITSSKWSWEETTNGTKSTQEINFYGNGLAENPKFFTARWEVAGPRLLVIENTKRGARQFGNKAYLVFDASLSHFVGFDFNGKTTVEGFRREAVDAERPVSEEKSAPELTSNAIVGTRWTFPVKGQPYEDKWIEFRADGVLQVGWNSALKTWKLLPGRRVQIYPYASEAFPFVISFQTDLLKGQIIEGESKGETIERVR